MTAYNWNVYERLNTPAEEAYRVLRTNIQFCGVDKQLKTLAITSCSPGEGKTTTAINLSISMAKSGKKTLLMDADLRKPMINKRFGGINSSGVSNWIAGNATLDEIIKSSNIENLYLIDSGPKPPNPAELLASPRFGELLKELSEKFDMVIIDTPPLGNVIDSALVSACADGTLLLVKAKTVDYRTALKVKEQLEKANARIIGVVLNNIKKSDYGSYRNYYRYYESDRQYTREWMGWLKRTKRSRMVEV